MEVERVTMTLAKTPSPARPKASLFLDLYKLIFLFLPVGVGLLSLVTRRVLAN